MNAFSKSLLLALVLPLQATLAQTYSHFEARHVHPIGLTPDGARLLALNTPDGRLSVFDISNPANPAPVLIGEIPVGVEPVSLKARTNDEVWVVNEVGDTVSVVSLSKGAVMDSLRAPDEPADVVFASGKAFVTCARSNAVRVFDAVTRQLLTTIPLTGSYPRSLVASADGTKVYAAFNLSGNRTTILHAAAAPAQPAPTNTSLPAAPDTALIVAADDSRINFTVLDNDIAEINAATSTVTRYIGGTGTNLFDIALHPVSGELWVANTESLNLTRFEPVLKGHFADHRLSKIALPGTAVTAYDLNPGINYALLPNPTAQANALAQPTAIVFAADGAHCWVAAFNSDRVAKVSSAGAVLARVDVRPVSANGSREMRGPRGLVLGMDGSRLFVLNKLSNTITTVDTASATVLAEVAAGSHDPMPQNIREGRGLLFDARLSGNGTGSCAICHIDSDRDGLAWDLGDPGGAMITVIGYNNSAHDTTTPRNRVMHPMKGPMTTQTLRGMKNPPNTPSNIPAPIFHWRGDRPTLQSFDVTFRDLMAGSLPPAPDMNVMADYLFSLLLHPNPFRGLNRALPATFQTSQGSGNPNNGRLIYLDHALSHCVTCHPLPTGSDQNIDIPGEVGSTQPVKTVHLRTVYQRSGFSRNAGAVNISGFGLLKDGTGNEFAIAHPYSLQQFETAQEFRDLEAFVHCFDTGVAPAVGHAITVTTLNRTSSTVLADLTTMEGQAVSNCNLVARGSISGKLRHYLYSPTPGNYSSDDITEPAITRTALLALLGAGDAITFTGVLAGEGARASTDRNANGTRNAQEAVPWLNCDMPSGILRLEWPASAADWYPETSATLQPPWLPLTTPRTTAPGVLRTEPASALPSGFYRLRRAW